MNQDRSIKDGEGNHLTIVVPVLNEQENVGRLYEELARVLPTTGCPWDIVYVDDGSTDGSWSAIMQLHEKNQSVKGIRFSRNFGHQYALFAGLSQAEGDAIVCMDGDLQHPPELIPKLVEQWSKGNKIVHTCREDPAKMPWFKKWSSRLFYLIFSFLSGVPLRSGMADFRLIDRQVAESLLQFREEGLFLRGIVQDIGFPSTTVRYRANERSSGQTKYGFIKMVRFAWTGITSFSLVPLRLSIVIGILTSLFAFYELGLAFYVKLFTDRAVQGWASAIGMVSLMFGILFILLGIIGEYIGRILIEVRDRPRYVIRQQIGYGRITHGRK
jgi:dolichol-phosphate mannosyltransferase